ncbi:MAG: DUF2066 domain-containing protein [Methyloceanibacter sp.]|nr:DUF2066 domain-containing protein [Methyloceanibacter sp.]
MAQLALLLSLALAASLSGAAQATDSLYAVGKISVDATAKDAVAAKAIGMADAEKRAVMTVLQRLVPLSALAQLPELSQDDIEAMVEGVSVRSEQNSTTRYLAVLDVNVNEAGVKQLLDGQGVPYSEVRAPSVSILLLVIAGGSVKDQGPEGWWQAWEDLDLSHSIAPATILKPRPNLDVETVKAVLAGDAQALAAMQGDYGYGPFVIAVGDIADGTFVTRLVGADGVGAINYGHSDKLSSADAKAAARDAAATAFAIIENRWKETQIPATPATEVNYEEGKEAKPPGNAEVPRNVVAIVEFSGLKDWQDIRGKLMNVAGIQALEVNSLSARAASISFDYAGSLDRLQTVLNQSGFQLNERDGNFVLRSR